MTLSFVSGDELKHASIPKWKGPMVLVDGLAWGLRRAWRKSHFPMEAALTTGLLDEAPSVEQAGWVGSESVRGWCHCHLTSRCGVQQLQPFLPIS